MTDLLQGHWAHIREDARCLRYLLRAMWVSATTRYLFGSERAPLPDKDTDLQDILAVLDILGELEGSLDDPRAQYLRAVIMWKLQRENAARDIWRSLSQETAFSDPRRVVRHHIWTQAGWAMSFESVLRIHQGINALARSLLGRAAFEDMNLLHPDPERAEPAFIRATSWLYCLYFEAGRVSITFLRRLGEAYALVNRELSDQHMETVRCLRTELHHNLGFADSDQDGRSAAGSWRRAACGTALPKTDQQWTSCYERFVSSAQGFLSGLDEVVRRVEADGRRAQEHIEEWKRRLNRAWPAADFDWVIDDAKYRLAHEALNTVAFRNRHIDQWRKQLDLLDDGFDFEFEAVRLAAR